MVFFIFFFQDHYPNFIDLTPLEESKPKIPIDELLEATIPMEPFKWDEKTDTPVEEF